MLVASREHESMRLVALAFLSALVASSAAAQTEEATARARELFQQGLEAARAEQWVDARDAFVQSLDIAERPSTLLNLAAAQVQTGQLVEGATSYRRFLELATEPREAAHRTQAQSALTALDARIPHVVVSVTSLQDGDQVRVDYQVLMATALGAPLALDPGPHDVAVIRSGRSVASQRVELAEGQSAQVSLDATPVVQAPVEVAATATTPPMDQAIAAPVPEARDDSHGDDMPLIIGLIVGAVVVVGVGVSLGVYFGTQGSGTATPYHGNFGDGVVHF
jgi:hypothetical protein